MSDVSTQLTQALRERYRIERELGAGGMATVYLAHDLKHERDVAIKVLHPDLAAALGAERFLSEIKTTAKLQHPHILPLIESGEADGLLYYVMPYVQGETLRARLTRERQLPVDDAVRLAREVASALDYAHRNGVIHRDIKPENILLHDGSAMVADFGIALAVSAASGPRMTQTGLSLGTPQYMSPEQAMGERTIDARADIYALGAVTYEMLAGEAPFTGPSVQAIVARVITEQPRPLGVQRRSVPPAVEQAVMKALEKLPADRFGTAKEFSEALVSTAAATMTRGMPAARPVAARALARPVVAAAGFAAVLIGAAAGWWLRRPAVDSAAPIRFAIALPASATRAPDEQGAIALSHDGRLVAFAAMVGTGQQIFTRGLGDLDAMPLSGTHGAYELCFSSDDQWIAFTTDAGLFKIAVGGGAAAQLLPMSDVIHPSWSASGQIIFAREGNHGLWQVSSGGGTPRTVAGSDAIVAANGWATSPVAAPDGKTVIYSDLGSARSNGSSRIAVLSLETGKRTVFDLPGLVPLSVVKGYVVYSQSDGELMAARIDLAQQTLHGQAIQLGVNVLARGGPTAAVSPGGTLAYVGGARERRLLLRSPNGRTEQLLPEERAYAHPRLSSDGRRLAVEIGNTDSSDLWIFDRDSKTLSRLTTGGSNQRPEWSADGKSIIYDALTVDTSRSTRRYGILRTPVDGSAPPDTIFKGEMTIREAVPVPGSADVVFRIDAVLTQRDLWLLSPGTPPTARPILSTPFDEKNPRVSPDRKWLAYSSNEGGASGHDVYVRAFPGPGPRVQVSQGGGIEPLWSADGRRIYYRNGRQMRVATLAMTPFPTVTTRDSLFDDRYASDGFHPDYDVTRDGAFVVLDPVAKLGIVVVANWGSELLERVKVP